MQESKDNQTEVQESSDSEPANIKQHIGWKDVLVGAKNWNFALVFLAVLPLIVYLLALPYMPDTISMHYNSKNELDRWGSKYEGLVVAWIALIFCVIWLWVRFLSDFPCTNNRIRI